jgi:threonine synthase
MSKVIIINYGAGNTRLDSCFKLGKYVGLNGNLFFKREDVNPTGSYKDRSFVYWISEILRAKPDAKFVISSSGNGAIAAAACCVIANRSLKIFLSDQGEPKKQWRLLKLLSGELKVGKWPFKSLAVNLQKYSYDEIKNNLRITEQRVIDKQFQELKKNIEVIKSERPKKDAMMIAKKENSINLRGSTDDLATVGYESIATELYQQCPGLTDLFLPASSGTGAVGIYKGFKKLLNQEEIKTLPRFYICQTEQVHSLLMQNDDEKSKKEVNIRSNSDNNVFKKDLLIKTQNSKFRIQNSVVPAICDLIGYRRKEIEYIIKETLGSGLIMNNSEIRRALFTSNKFGFKIGVEGGLALAGINKAKKNKIELGNYVICLVTGR